MLCKLLTANWGLGVDERVIAVAEMLIFPAFCFCLGCEGGDFAGSECKQLQRYVTRAVLWHRDDPAQQGL